VVWPWLLGPFVRAYLRAYGRGRERIAYCRALFRGLELHLSEACLGSVSEIFEAEPPFRPVGAPAQAWSVAELLEVLSRELNDDGAARRLYERASGVADRTDQSSQSMSE
jgi:glycogen debranching enzyme